MGMKTIDGGKYFFPFAVLSHGLASSSLTTSPATKSKGYIPLHIFVMPLDIKKFPQIAWKRTRSNSDIIEVQPQSVIILPPSVLFLFYSNLTIASIRPKEIGNRG